MIDNELIVEYLCQELCLNKLKNIRSIMFLQIGLNLFIIISFSMFIVGVESCFMFYFVR